MKEAEEKAKQASAEGKTEEMARTLLGPRGGIPTIRRDLLQLAALLKINLAPKATNEEIKAACRPIKGHIGWEFD